MVKKPTEIIALECLRERLERELRLKRYILGLNSALGILVLAIISAKAYGLFADVLANGGLCNAEKI